MAITSATNTKPVSEALDAPAIYPMFPVVLDDEPCLGTEHPPHRGAQQGDGPDRAGRSPLPGGEQALEDQADEATQDYHRQPAPADQARNLGKGSQTGRHGMILAVAQSNQRVTVKVSCKEASRSAENFPVRCRGSVAWSGTGAGTMTGPAGGRRPPSCWRRRGLSG